MAKVLRGFFFCPTNIGGDFYPTPIVLMINGKSYRSYRLHHSLLVAFTWQKLTANDILLYFDWFSKSIWFFFHLFICYHSASVWWWRWFSLEIFVCWHQHYSSYSIIQLFCLPMCTTWVWVCVCVCMGKRDNNIGLGQITFDQITSWQIER